MKKAIFCVIALGISVATVYGQDEVTAINTRQMCIRDRVIRCIHWEVFIR